MVLSRDAVFGAYLLPRAAGIVGLHHTSTLPLPADTNNASTQPKMLKHPTTPALGRLVHNAKPSPDACG